MESQFYDATPRGSSGYGTQFRLSSIKDWGGGDAQDLLHGVDLVISMGIVDTDRIGICGWSYGGYLACSIITQTSRFKAASIGGAIINAISYNATSDIPDFIPKYFGAEYWEDLDIYLRLSPLFRAREINTPCLIQHGENDRRSALEQSLQLYHALRSFGVLAELHVYPEQGHSIYDPHLLEEAIQANIEWFISKL